MAAILKTELRVLNSDLFRARLASIPAYYFIAGTSAWDNEFSPPVPKDTISEEHFALKELVGLKRISEGDLCSVLPRINWESGSVYDQYDDTIDLINTKNEDTDKFWQFYVLTQNFDVYKCLNNANGAPSTTSPSGTSSDPFTTPDGYVWKYMYSIPFDDTTSFTTTAWMPCYTKTYNDGSTQWASQQAAVPGTIDNIVLTNVGGGNSASSPPTVVITGDGTDAAATASVNPVTGVLTKLTITNPGKNYTTATISLTGTGVGGEARAVISPREGHGYDPRVELGATYLMVNTTLDGDEDGKIPTDISYRIVGILEKPNSFDEGVFIQLGEGKANLFQVGDEITGETSSATGTILLIDEQHDQLYINSVVGVFSQTESISSQTYNLTEIVSIEEIFTPLTSLVYTDTDYKKETGQILFLSYREKIDRLDQQKEELISLFSF